MIELAADIFPGKGLNDTRLLDSELAIHLDDDGYYWHLYRYFETAKLPGQHELVDLYGSNEIDGYQLTRLQEVLTVAKKDLEWRPDEWFVVIGWEGHSISRESEIRRSVKKQELIELIDRFNELIDYCIFGSLRLCVVGD